MKKLFLLAVCSFFAVSSFAQETEEAVAKKPSNQGIVSNKFWDNWELSFGAGPATEDIANKPGDGNNDHGSFWHRIGWEANVSATKWFHPIWGVRLQLQGGQFKGYRTAASENPERTPHIFLHGDVMVNLSNWIGGYREDRVYYAVPFVGFGVQALDFTKAAHDNGYGTNKEFAATGGLLNKFRVCKCIDINLELKTWLYREGDHALAGNGQYINAWSATAGISYRFNQRDWHREVIYTGPNAADYAAMVAERDAALAAAAAQPKVVERVVEKTNTIYAGTKMMVFFAFDKSYLTIKEKIRLDSKIEQIKNGPADKVYTIVGYADAQTGSAAYNQKLSEKRAQAVYDYLVSQGVKAEQLKVEGKGASVQPYGTKETNRVVIVE